MDITKYFGHSNFFQGVGKRSQELLAGICIEKNAARKEMLFAEGDRGHSLYLLADGAVGLYKTTADGKEVVIKVVRPGELFAEVILFELDRYPVSAVAMTASRLFLLPKRQFYRLLENVEFRNDFIGMLMKKQRYLAERISYLTTNDVEDRFFIFIREQYGNCETIVPGLSKKDVAAAIGTTPETYSRMLARLSSEGKISMEGKKIHLKGGCRSHDYPK
jgi:CRP-like cAMP-binding protein